jgi:hypothetical protein
MTERFPFGTSNPMTPFPGMLGTTRTDSHRIARARSPAIATTRFAFTPGAGRNSYVVTRGPVRISVTVPSIPCSESLARRVTAFRWRVSSSAPFWPAGGGARRSSGGSRNSRSPFRLACEASGTRAGATILGEGGSAEEEAAGSLPVLSFSRSSWRTIFSLTMERTCSDVFRRPHRDGRPLSGRPVRSIRENRSMATRKMRPPTLLRSFPNRLTPRRCPTIPGRKMSDWNSRTWPVKKLRIPRREHTASRPPAVRLHLPVILSPRNVQYASARERTGNPTAPIPKS